MKFAICDDDRQFLRVFRPAVESWCAKQDIVGQYQTFTSPVDLLEADLSSVQVLFLDIEMPNCSGIDAAKTLRQRYPALILVFVTAWLQYAPEGYHVEAFRYLLKSRLADSLEPCLDAVREKISASQQMLSLRTRDSALDLPLKDILYLEGTGNRAVLVHCLPDEGSPLECAGKLQDLEAQLGPHGFLRIQRSYLVNMAWISRITGYSVFLRSGTTLKVSEKNYGPVCTRYLTWKGQRL